MAPTFPSSRAFTHAVPSPSVSASRLCISLCHLSLSLSLSPHLSVSVTPLTEMPCGGRAACTSAHRCVLEMLHMACGVPADLLASRHGSAPLSSPQPSCEPPVSLSPHLTSRQPPAFNIKAFYSWRSEEASPGLCPSNLVLTPCHMPLDSRPHPPRTPEPRPSAFIFPPQLATGAHPLPFLPS